MLDRSLVLLDQIIEMAQAQEVELNTCRLAQHKALLTVGEGALLHHLKLLKELLEKEATLPEQVILKEKAFTVSRG